MPHRGSLLVLLLLAVSLSGCDDSLDYEGSNIGISFHNDYGKNLSLLTSNSVSEAEDSSARGESGVLAGHGQHASYTCNRSHHPEWMRFELYDDHTWTMKLDEKVWAVECFGDYILTIDAQGKMSFADDPNPGLKQRDGEEV